MITSSTIKRSPRPTNSDTARLRIRTTQRPVCGVVAFAPLPIVSEATRPMTVRVKLDAIAFSSIERRYCRKLLGGK